MFYIIINSSPPFFPILLYLFASSFFHFFLFFYFFPLSISYFIFNFYFSKTELIVPAIGSPRPSGVLRYRNHRESRRELGVPGQTGQFSTLESRRELGVPLLLWESRRELGVPTRVGVLVGVPSNQVPFWHSQVVM